MSLFTWISLIVAISCALLAIFTFLQARKQIHFILGIFNVNVALWCLGLYLVGIAHSPLQAIFYWKLALVPNVFISVFLYHLVYAFCQLNEKRLLILVYLQGILFALSALLYKPFLTEVSLIFNTIYFAKDTPLISLWLSIFSLITGIAFYRMWQFVNKATGEKKVEALYLFWGMLVGFGGGFTIALPLYGIPIYPSWHLLISVYAGIFTFSILRHRFLDIRVGLIRMLIPACILMVILFFFCFIYFDMTLFSVASLSMAVLCAPLAFFVFAYSTKKVHRIWAIFNLIVATWGLANFLAGMSTTPERALIFWRIVCLVCTFLSVVYYHVIAEFCGIKRSRMLSFAYIQGALFVPLIIFSDYFIGSTFYAFDSIHYYKATTLFTVWAAIWFIITGSAFVELYKFIKRSKGIQKTQALYLFWAPLLGHTGGAITILPAFNLPIYPAWHFSVCIYAVVSTYAIFRYQIMDIRIAVTRLGVFIVVYSLVLGIPFGLAVLGQPWLVTILGEKWFWAPMLTLLFLATAGPFIYLYFQRRAEGALLQEERRIQALLNQVSVGMTTIRDLAKLEELVVDILVKSLRLDNAEIYLYDPDNSHYQLKASRGEDVFIAAIDKDAPLIQRLVKKKFPVVYEELKLLSDSHKVVEKQHDTIRQMDELKASVIIPALVENILLGFIVLGERKDKRTYSFELLNVLSVLGNQAALAIENCNFMAAEAMRLEREGLEERRLSLDHVASSMAHEIDNPMTVINGQVESLQSLLDDPRLSAPDDWHERARKSMDYILEARARVSGMIRAIQDYSKKTSGELKPIKIAEVEDGYWKLIGHAFKKELKVNYTKDLAEDLPYILGDRIQLEEVLINFANNALHAVRYSEVKKIQLKIFLKDDDWMRIEYSDTGYGIEKKIIKDVFLAHVTTKGSVEGTGLGLFRVRKIVELHKGRVWAESEGKNKGARMVVELPVFKGDIRAQVVKEKFDDIPKRMF